MSMRLSTVAVASLVLVAPALAAQGAVQVDMRSRVYRGERVKVRVAVRADGYLVVLRADTYGRVQVLHPKSPEDAGWVGGGRSVGHSFEASETAGEGMVLAALSEQPYSFNLYTTSDGKWDRALLGQQQIATGGEGEEALLNIVRRMSGTDDFDFDLVAYQVRARTSGPWYPLGTHFHDRWDGCYRPVFGSYRWGLWSRWYYQFAPIGVDAFDYYFHSDAYRSWCGYAPRWGWTQPVIVVTTPPVERPGRFTFKDRPGTRRPPLVEPRRRDPSSLTFRRPVASDARRGRFTTQHVRTRTTRDVWSGFNSGRVATRRQVWSSGGTWSGARSGVQTGGASARGGSAGPVTRKSTSGTTTREPGAITARRPN